jgi:hypothetical protein
MTNKMVDLRYSLNTPCDKLNSLSERDINSVVGFVFSYYRVIGFPFYRLSEREKIKTLEGLLSKEVDKLELEGGRLQQVMAGLSLANSYHPHMWKTRCKKAKTPFEVFSDNVLFKKAIRKRIKYSDSKLSPFNIRKALKTFTGAQSVSNFRPTIAKYIYQKYCPAGGNVLDPCFGYSGRLLGAWASHIGRYEGCDPCVKTYEGSLACSHDLSLLTKKMNKEMLLPLYNCPEIVLHNMPFEEFKTESEYDLVFTSPPYYNLEKYSDEPTQSYMKYKSYYDWKTWFLKPLILISQIVLRQNGYFVLNVGGEPLVADTIKIGTEVFEKEPEVLYMRLSKMIGSRNNKGFKEEPILVWKKN